MGGPSASFGPSSSTFSVAPATSTGFPRAGKRCSKTATPAYVASAKITSAAARSTGNIRKIRFEIVIAKLRIGTRSGFGLTQQGRVIHRTPQGPFPYSYSRHRPLPISKRGTFRCSRARDFGDFAGPAFPHNPQQPVDANAVVMRGIFGGFR